jgi:CSLREA domain-containing protein
MRRRGFRFVGLVLAAGPLVIACPGFTPAWAAGTTYTVNSTADTPDADVGSPACADATGKCTLRAAIMQANFTAGADTIKLPAGTFTLTRPGDDDGAILGDLDITDSVTIVGAGSAKTIIDGNGAITHDRVFQVLSTATDTTLRDLTIRNGKKTANTFDEGGGLYWDGGGGRLNLTRVVVSGNRASYGGGLFLSYSPSGDAVTLNQVVVRSNTATAAAGGLAATFDNSAGFDLVHSQVYGNTAYQGGGVYLFGNPSFGLGSVLIEDSSISSNSASINAGMENDAVSASHPVTVLNSSFHNNNSAVYQGGAITNTGTLAVSGSTLNANSAGTKTSALGGGGALYQYGLGSVTFTNDTLSGNTATIQGGGIDAESGTSASLTNVTLSGNSAPAGGGIYSGSTSVALTNTLVAHGSAGANCNVALGGSSNLSDDGSCGFGSGRDSLADLMLGPLAKNGGLTLTRLPHLGSPALDSGQPLGAPPTDQRGIPRPQGAEIDVGAVERCLVKPGRFSLRSPADTSTVAGPTVALDWGNSSCATKYQVVVRMGSTTGTIAYSKKNLTASQATTTALAGGRTYYWSVTASGDAGDRSSAWFSFAVG